MEGNGVPVVKYRRPLLISAAALVCLGLAAVPGAKLYYQSSWGEACARCHEIQPNFDSWQHSSHRKINCTQCHASSLEASVRRIVLHARGEVPESFHLRLNDVFGMMERCKSCHQQEFAQWRAGPHATTYSRIFTDPKHNEKRRLMDDCLRCHGMYFGGGVTDLVEPVSTTGPWKLKDPKLAMQPAIPCLACHSIHRQGAPMFASQDRTGPKQEKFRPSLALMDRRSQLPISLAILPIPPVMEGARTVRVSPDQRQALCYQCHAPLSTNQVGTGRRPHSDWRA